MLKANLKKLAFISFFHLLLLYQKEATAQNYYFDMGKIAIYDPSHLTFSNPLHSRKKALTYHEDSLSSFFNLWFEDVGSRIQEFKYLYFEVEHAEKYAVILKLDFYAKSESRPRVSAKIGVLPALKTQVIFPLDYLDAQSIFLPRYPRQLKGFITGHSLKKEELTQVKISLEPKQKKIFNPKMTFFQIVLSKALPKPLSRPENAVLDEFGQPTANSWKRKIESDSSLKSQLRKSAYRIEWKPGKTENLHSEYGGLKSIQFKATGFFRTHFDGSRWWFVDPLGYAFLSTGVNGILPTIAGPYEGMEDLIPDSYGHFQDNPDVFFTARDMPHLNYLAANYLKVFGKNWRSHWFGITYNEFRKAGFNTIGNWSTSAFIDSSKLPFVFPLTGFPSTKKCIFRDFPDVFDSSYISNAKVFAKQIEPLKTNPYLLGYFLGNEPEWAFGKNNLAYEMLTDTVQSKTRDALVQELKSKYQNIAQLNESWQTTYLSFEEISKQSVQTMSEKGYDELWKFSLKMVDQYFGPVCRELKKVDPNHLNLGIRYAYISSDLGMRAGSFFDVFSLNGYGFEVPQNTGEISKITGRPILIGEFHFGSLDNGLPATGIVGTASVFERASSTRSYVEKGFAKPEIIGIHYFEWNNQPYLGRFDGENYGIGLFDVCGMGTKPVLQEYKKANSEIYNLALRKKIPYKRSAKNYPSIFY